MLMCFEGRKKGNVLFNEALNTFYLWLYGVRHKVKYNSDTKRGDLLLPHRLFFLISSKGWRWTYGKRSLSKRGNLLLPPLMRSQM